MCIHLICAKCILKSLFTNPQEYLNVLCNGFCSQQISDRKKIHTHLIVVRKRNSSLKRVLFFLGRTLQWSKNLLNFSYCSWAKMQKKKRKRWWEGTLRVLRTSRFKYSKQKWKKKIIVDIFVRLVWQLGFHAVNAISLRTSITHTKKNVFMRLFIRLTC